MNPQREPATALRESGDCPVIQVVIPAYNEEATLGGVLERLQAQGLRRIRVVDNGSQDRTAAVARAQGAEVVREARRGYGQACFTGCENLPPDTEWILFCDADGSDDLEALPQFLEAMPQTDFLVGNRLSDAGAERNLTPAQRFGNALSASILRLLYGVRFHDLGPLRAVRADAYRAMEMRDRGFGWTVEMQARACELGLRIRELPVRSLPRQAGVSKISGTLRGSVQAGTIILTTLAAFIGRRLAKPAGVLARKNHQPSTATCASLPRAASRDEVGDFSGLGLGLLFAGTLLMTWHSEFSAGANAGWFMAGAGLAGVGWLLSLAFPGGGAPLFWSVSIGLRLVLLAAAPGTDVWRYLWEGLVHLDGQTPYLHAPSSTQLEALRTEWWPRINHPEVPAAYPPLVQAVFAAVAALSPTVLALKLVLVLPDLAVAGLLANRFGPERARLYAWCPLVLYAFAGGAHYDSLLLLPMVAGWLTWERGGSRRATALLLGTSVAMKYVTAPLAAFLAWRILRERGFGAAVRFSLLALAPALLAFWLYQVWFGVAPIGPAGFALIARSAEFVPHYLSRAFAIDPLGNLVVLVGFAAGTLALLFLARNLVTFAEDYFFLLYLLTPVLHPWYFTWALPFAVATRNAGLIAVTMSAFAYFTLELRAAGGDASWELTGAERLFLWSPLILGFLYSRWRTPVASLPDHRHPRAPGKAP